MGKQVRSFYLDHQVGALMDEEATLTGKSASALVEELLKEALARRRAVKAVKNAVLDFSQATATMISVVIVLWFGVLVFV